jgi:hypothetical protein
MTPRRRLFGTAAAVLFAAAAVSGCASKGGAETAQSERSSGFLGMGGKQDVEPSQIGVNSFLWQAALETLSFMPLTSADQQGGVIISDWFADAKSPNERFKATVYILDTRLRADALKVAVFRQVKQGSAWVDAAVDPDTGLQIENAILRQARQLKLDTIGG